MPVEPDRSVAATPSVSATSGEDIAEKEASTPPADDEEVAVAADEVAGEVEAEQELE